MDLTHVDEPRSMLEAQLGPREKLLWAGRPPRGIMLCAIDAFLIPFSLMWGGFAFFWEYSVITEKAPVFFSLWGIPFVLVGLYVVIGRFLVDRKQREKTSYGITNERVLIVSGVFSQTVKSLNLRTLSDVTMTERGDGSGSIAFGPTHPYSWWTQGMGGWPGVPVSPGFDRIPDVKGVYETLCSAGQGINGRSQSGMGS
jgi:Bacterial PH domain